MNFIQESFIFWYSQTCRCQTSSWVTKRAFGPFSSTWKFFSPVFNPRQYGDLHQRVHRIFGVHFATRVHAKVFRRIRCGHRFRWGYSLLGGGNSNVFWCSPRKLGKIPILTKIFQRSWFNHQLASLTANAKRKGHDLLGSIQAFRGCLLLASKRRFGLRSDHFWRSFAWGCLFWGIIGVTQSFFWNVVLYSLLNCPIRPMRTYLFFAEPLVHLDNPVLVRDTHNV